MIRATPSTSITLTPQPSAIGGYALLGVLMLVSLLMTLLGAYMKISHVELASTRYSQNMVRGFYAAEAGLNLRAEKVRQSFVGYNRPDGVAPTSGDECIDGNTGSGDFACESESIGSRVARSYVQEDPANPYEITIPPGERFQNLSAQEYRYTVVSNSLNAQDEIEAILQLRFRSRLVPMFQFAAFYDKDLEILPGPNMTIGGPVHVNGDLYLNANNTLRMDGQVSATGALFRGRKNDASCSGTVEAKDPSTFQAIKDGCSTRTDVDSPYLLSWNGMVQRDVETVEVPEPDFLDPVPGKTYWDKADIRLVLKLDASNTPDSSNSSTAVEVRLPDQTVDGAATAALESCTGAIDGAAVGNSNTFYNNRESAHIRMLEIDAEALLDCIHLHTGSGDALLISNRELNDTTEGGLVMYFTVEGPHSSDTASDYGVRIRNAAHLQSSISTAAKVRGITMVSDHAVYVLGDFNSDEKIPAAILADTFNVLSNNWNANDLASTQSLSNRTASTTRINVAILAGTDTTGGQEGSAGQGGSYNGGLENYPRLHENWSGRTLRYFGSFVSLDTPRHASGAWVYGSPYYSAPIRDWHYDTDFNDAAKLPPLSPRFVYLRQELFLRDFEQ